MGDKIDVRTIARGRWRGILMALGLDERTLTDKHGPCPLCGGKNRFRFDDREGRGTYICNRCGAGDGVQLAMGVTRLPFREAARRIEELAGAVQPSVITPERSDDDKLAALRLRNRESAPITNADEAVRYLRGRGLALRDLPESLRLHRGLTYYDGGKQVGTYPAMIGIVTDPTGQVVSIHRTYLHNGKKAPVSAPKKLMRGLPIAGAAIRLTPVSECMGIAEGIETALAASELFEVPTWSCISTSGIESFEPPVGVKEVVIFADHDENFAGQAAAYPAAHRLALKGLKVEVCVPPSVGDWLDELNRRKAVTEATEGKQT